MTGFPSLESTSIVWTPSHIGIKGNELVDRAAHESAENQAPEDIAIRPEDMKVYLKEYTLNWWQEKWNRDETQLKNIKPTIEKWITPRD